MSGVYVITDGEHFKIGIADDPARRLRELQTGNGRKLHLGFFIHANDAKRIEARAHGRLAELRREGEWFACEFDCAVWAVLSEMYPDCLDDGPGEVYLDASYEERLCVLATTTGEPALFGEPR